MCMKFREWLNHSLGYNRVHELAAVHKMGETLSLLGNAAVACMSAMPPL